VVHWFPNPKLHMERLLKCIELIDVKNCDPYVIYRKKHICALHFSLDCSSSGTKKLNANAYPTLLLPAGKIALHCVNY